MEKNTIIEYPRICHAIKTDKCVYDTQGKVGCNGLLTQGANKTESVKQTKTDANTQLFQRFVDERFSWR